MRTGKSDATATTGGTRTVEFRGSGSEDPRRRYALASLLDPLGLRLADREEAPAAVTVTDDDALQAGVVALKRVRPGLLEDAFAALTLAGESGALLDEHGRPAAPPTAPPVIAELTTLLAWALEDAGAPARMSFKGGERFAVALTHDVDVLGGGRFAALRSSVLGVAPRPWSASARRERQRARAYLSDLWAGRDPAFPLAEMVRVEQAFGWKSTCYFLVRNLDRLDGVDRRYLDRLEPAVAACDEHGLEVGLHASYRSRERPDAIAKETALFKRLTGRNATGMRHHFLRSQPDRLGAQLRLAGLEYDTSIGWAARSGARAGTPYPYRLWDAVTGESGAWELPLFVMDRTFDKYLGLDADEAYEAAVAALEPVATAGGACALLWHPPYHHPLLADGYDVTYRRLLDWIEERGGKGGTARETLERWRTRVPAGEQGTHATPAA